ncbi:cytochrome c biogenesis protein ResB [Desulfoferrobacter suflitae]|uniref:cytochrome c biogenesis protein ResB n=1 Tax=Desulfoferrobacter suflitae TaxID=2865782 RepID=UPI002164298B|nr:cytochrome c biogenesis protein ResB [Desulfoferrobacter suflitae]MCK8604314.1 cytochrome c biogenesis protein ResB [Desulfoferrobacter suflitae]
MQQKSGLGQYLYQSFASMKLSVFIFLTLAACSLVGTLLPQGTTQHELHTRYSPGVARIIDTLGLNDLYHTTWFRLLLVLLTVNLVVCTLRRLPKTLRQLSQRDESITPDKLTKFAYHCEIRSPLPRDQVEAKVTSIISHNFGTLRRSDHSEAFAGIVEVGRWSRWMVYVVHLSVLLVLVGALIGSLLGFRGYMNIVEGGASRDVRLYRGNNTVTLPFEVRCNSFQVSFYDTGAPKEYRSDLTIVDDGKDALTRSIIVNDPLSYAGVTLYQSSYGAVLKRAQVEFRNTDTGKSSTLTLQFGEAAVIPDTTDRVQMVDYQKNMGQFGPAVGIALVREGEQPKGSWILVNLPQFHGNKIQNYQIQVLKTEDGYYTGLQVKKDPGVWVVYTGFMAMLVGIGMTFYTSHRKLWVWADTANPGKNSTRILMAGKTSKNPVAFEREFNELRERLENDLKSRVT